MCSVIVKLVAIMLTLQVGAISCKEVPSVPDFSLFLQQYQKVAERLTSNPEMVLWIQRASDRLSTNQNATKDDLKKLWRTGVNLSRNIHNFVTSPEFNKTTDIIIEQVAQLVSPIVAVVPLREINELYKIVRQNPDILEMILKQKVIDYTETDIV